MSIQTDDFGTPPPARMVDAKPETPQEEAIERALRPKLLDDYVGQAKVREQHDGLVIIELASYLDTGAANGTGNSLNNVIDAELLLKKAFFTDVTPARLRQYFVKDQNQLRLQKLKKQILPHKK